jgi:DNA-binding transcriptional ArsR family regulator
MADPVRSRVLLAVAEAETDSYNRAMGSDRAHGITVRQISNRLEEPRRRVRYHLDALCDQGIVEVAAEKMRRGVVERHYRAVLPPVLTKEQLETLSTAQQQKILLEILKVIFADTTAALKAGSYVRRPEWAAVRLRGEVDEQGWRELAALHENTRRESQRIVAGARERLGKKRETPIQVGSVNLLFEAAPRAGE